MGSAWTGGAAGGAAGPNPGCSGAARFRRRCGRRGRAPGKAGGGAGAAGPGSGRSDPAPPAPGRAGPPPVPRKKVPGPSGFSAFSEVIFHALCLRSCPATPPSPRLPCGGGLGGGYSRKSQPEKQCSSPPLTLGWELKQKVRPHEDLLYLRSRDEKTATRSLQWDKKVRPSCPDPGLEGFHPPLCKRGVGGDLSTSTQPLSFF